MANLENSLFIMPDLLAVHGGTMYVRFPTDRLASGNGVRDMWLNLSLPFTGDALVVHLRKITSPWDEQSVQQVVQGHRNILATGIALPYQSDISISIVQLMDEWLYARQNHGLMISYAYEGYAFNEASPPILEIIQEPLRSAVVQ